MGFFLTVIKFRKMNFKITHTLEASLYPLTVSSSEAITDVKNIPLKASGIANRVKIFVTTLLFLLSFFSRAQDDSVLKVSTLKELSLEELMNITVITASGSEQTISEAPSTIRVVTAKQIEECGYEQLEDVLRNMEGVDLIHIGGYMPTIIYFRGLYGAENLRTLLLIDGIRENNMVGSNDLAGPAYSMHNIERIEIIWGPASALYGADAFGGVINIITKKGAAMNNLHYEKEYGTFNSSADRLMFGAKKNNIDFSFSGSLYSTDGPKYTNRNPYYTGAFVDKARSFYGNITHTYKKFKTTLGYRAFNTPMSWGNFLNSSTKALGLPNQGNQNSGAIGIITEDIRNEKPSLYESFSRTAFLQTEFTASPKLSIFARTTYRKTGLGDKSYIYLSIDTNLAPGIDTAHIYRIPTFNYSNRIKGEISAIFSPFENHKIYAGIQYFQDNLETGNRGEILDTNKYNVDGVPVTNLYPTMKPRVYSIRNNFGSYLQYVLTTKLLNKTSFTAGLRYDKNTDYKNPFSPRIAIINQPNDKFTIKLLYGTAFRAPTPSEVASQITSYGSKAVNPEKVSTYEMNFIYSPSPKFLIQVNGFDNELTDIYVLNSLIGNGLGSKQSLGKASIYGGEARINVFPTELFSCFINYTYQHGRQTDLKTSSTFDIPNLPNYKGNVGITYRGKTLFTLTIIENWIGERLLPQSNPYGADKGYKMDGYFLTNVVLTTKQFFNNRVSASVKVNNVFNVHYLEPGMRTADGKLYSTVLEQPGINGLFKISVNIF